MTHGILENMNKIPDILCVRRYKKTVKIQSATSKCLSITPWTDRVGLGERVK